MFKYCDTVRDIAHTEPPFVWRLHDEQFHGFRYTDPARFRWDQPKWDQGRTVRSLSPSTIFYNQSFSAGYCWIYQRRGSCTANSCRFKHAYAKCQGKHPASVCRQGKRAHLNISSNVEQGYDIVEASYLVMCFKFGLYLHFEGFSGLRLSIIHPFSIKITSNSN